MKICAYGGSFDPATNGHLELMLRAAVQFDKVLVVVAPNYSKPNSEFTPEERKALIEQAINSMDGTKCFICSKNKMEYLKKKISVDILPRAQFLASYVKSKNVTALIRGLRDNIDFASEQKIGDSNKRISPELDTIYMMPSADYIKVSSSWAKSMVGFKGWQKAVEDYVPENVVRGLECKWLGREIKYILEECTKHGIIDSFGFSESAVSDIISAYSGREYHNFSHISAMLMNYTYYVVNNQSLFGHINHCQSLQIKMAILLHDIVSDESSCVYWPENNCVFNLRGHHKREINSIIMATKHAITEEQEEQARHNMSTQEQIIHDLDLLVLASKEYEKYKLLIKAEYVSRKYTENQFLDGRADFLRLMLKRPSIFYTSYFRQNFEETARQNMQGELTENNRTNPLFNPPSEG